jgi:hypothetical protein
MEHTSQGQKRIVRSTGNLNLGISGLEENIVQHLHRYISSLLLDSALAAPAVIMAAPRPQDERAQIRVYDRTHRDYHNWNDNEDRAYRQYLAEQRRSYRGYDRQNNRFQKHYWNWRHSHPDHD